MACGGFGARWMDSSQHLARVHAAHVLDDLQACWNVSRAARSCSPILVSSGSAAAAAALRFGQEMLYSLARQIRGARACAGAISPLLARLLLGSHLLLQLLELVLRDSHVGHGLENQGQLIFVDLLAARPKKLVEQRQVFLFDRHFLGFKSGSIADSQLGFKCHRLSTSRRSWGSSGSAATSITIGAPITAII